MAGNLRAKPPQKKHVNVTALLATLNESTAGPNGNSTRGSSTNSLQRNMASAAPRVSSGAAASQPLLVLESPTESDNEETGPSENVDEVWSQETEPYYDTSDSETLCFRVLMY